MPANLLLLDEPTNHLDIPAREAIESFMRETPATLLVVSHDRRMLETVCDRLWVVDGGSAVAVRRRLPRLAGRRRRWLDGGRRDRGRGEAAADGWATRRRHGRRGRGGAAARRPFGSTAAAARRAGVDQRVRPRVASAQRRRSSRRRRPGPRGGTDSRRTRGPKLSKDAYRRQRAALDAELTRLGLRKNHLELAMGDPSVAANFVELRRMSSELADVSTALEAAEEAWLELEERAP